VYHAHVKEPLTPWLVEWAYSQGIFPMGLEDGSVGWFRPEARAVIPIGRFHASRSLRRSARRFDVTFDCAFEEVMRKCADRKEGTWITAEFFQVYAELHRRGLAHSCEAWSGEELVGGVYGVAIGRAFMAESMFHVLTDAGKVALWKLMQRLQNQGCVLFDVQYMTEHLRTLGAVEISDKKYRKMLCKALESASGAHSFQLGDICH
jgi:leucyl/phenylalanyl-tRNA--protein transferase